MINVGTNFAVGANSMNVIVYERRIGKTGKNAGKVMWKESAYFATVHGALNYLVELHVRETKLKDVKTVCLKIDELTNLIKTLEIPQEV